MTFLLFLDESGDHGLSNISVSFPVFVLAGVLTDTDSYKIINHRLDELKQRFWGKKNVILHSRDIRKCEKEFAILFDLELKRDFYLELNDIVKTTNYQVFSTAIDKPKYQEAFGSLADDVYEAALSSLMEDAILHIESENKGTEKPFLKIVIEKRGKNEDTKLAHHFQQLLNRGTGKIKKERMKKIDFDFEFKDKKDNLNGLQLADLVAYPIARYVIEPNRANPAFDLVESKVYKRSGQKSGIKILP
jgi:hypothetical protein